MLDALTVFFPSREEEPAPEKPKKKLRIRFSIFFDGTKNNRDNIAEREKYEIGRVPVTKEDKKSAKAYTDFGRGDDNSYDNGRTNIAIMEACAVPNQAGYHKSYSIYMEGQGTHKYQKDDLPGYAMGALDSGVANRAEEGVKAVVARFLEWAEDFNDTYTIEKIDVDVFGFSRGAAAARHSISLMLEWLAPDTILPNRPLYSRLKGSGFEIAKKSVEIKFAGLFDTVVSVNGSQLRYDSDDKLNQRAVALATKSVHLCAADEHRLDFPLHTIQSALAKGTGKQYYLPGAHSDVGGSYNLANGLQTNDSVVKIVRVAGSFDDMTAMRAELVAKGAFTSDKLIVEVTGYKPTPRTGGVRKVGKLIELRTVKQSDKLMRPSSEIDKVIHCGDAITLNIDKDRLVQQGWYRPDEIEVKSFGLGYTVVNRKNIKSAYSNIPLKIMANLAVENGIRFRSKLFERANLILSAEPDLLKLEESINAYVAKMGNAKSRPEDWLEDATMHHSDQRYPIERIRHDHLHVSVQTTKVTQLNPGYTPRFTLITGKRRRYYYDG